MWGLIALAPTLFVLLLGLAFNDITVPLMLVIIVGLGVSGSFFYRAHMLNREAILRDTSSIIRKPERSSSRRRRG